MNCNVIKLNEDNQFINKIKTAILKSHDFSNTMQVRKIALQED